VIQPGRSGSQKIEKKRFFFCFATLRNKKISEKFPVLHFVSFLHRKYTDLSHNRSLTT
jgi:hypothetical protein